MLDDSKTRDFLAEFTKHSRRIYGFVRALVPNQADAEELYQDVSTLLWEKFGDFQPGSDFRAWAFQIAHYRVLSFRQRKSTQQKVFSDAFSDAVESELAAPETESLLDARFRALADCYGKLSSKDRALVDRRYLREMDVKAVAKSLGRGVDYVYKSLRRIHGLLFDCISRQVAVDPHVKEGRE